jgi:hypothetical protein
MKTQLDRSTSNEVYLARLFTETFLPFKETVLEFDSAARAPILSLAVEFPVLTGCEVAGETERPAQ